MFLQEEIKEDKRPFMAVYAPDHNFVYKYFDRRFDRRITEDPAEAAPGSVAVAITTVGAVDHDKTTDFRNKALSNNLRVITLSVPDIIGTGMTGLPMRLARGVARGTMLKIKDNEARRSFIHAIDVAEAASVIAQAGQADAEFVISAEPVEVNRLLEALGHRIKDKRIGTIAPRWARILYGKELLEKLTTDCIADASAFKERFPEFVFTDPAEYLTTHIYDNDSL